MALPAFAADRRPAGRAAVDRYLSAEAACGGRVGQTDRETDGRTLHRYIDPAAHTEQAVPIKIQCSGLIALYGTMHFTS